MIRSDGGAANDVFSGDRLGPTGDSQPAFLLQLVSGVSQVAVSGLEEGLPFLLSQHSQHVGLRREAVATAD